MESIYSNPRSPDKLETSMEKNELVSKDLVAFVVLSDKKFCLAVLQTTGFHFKNEKTLKMSMDLDNITAPCGSGWWDWTKQFCYRSTRFFGFPRRCGACPNEYAVTR